MRAFLREEIKTDVPMTDLSNRWNPVVIRAIREPGSRPMGYFNMAEDPLSLAAERASICLFLRRDLSVLPETCAIELDEATLKLPDARQTMSRMPGRWAAWYLKLGTRFGTSSD